MNGFSGKFLRFAMVLLMAVLCVSVAYASGSTTNRYTPLWQKMKPKKGEPMGCLAGSVGRSTGPGYVNVFFFTTLLFTTAEQAGRSNPHTASVYWTEGPLDHRSKLVGDGVARDAFNLCLRPGKYVFLGQVFGGGISALYLDKPYSVPIDVVAGKTTYIGSFVAYGGGRNDGCGVASTARMSVSDRFEQDREAIKALNDRTGNELVWAIPDFSGLTPTLYYCGKKAAEPVTGDRASGLE